jgi:hypothetical protein
MVPSEYPEPGLFQQSLGWLDGNGLRLRYETFYSNGFPTPVRPRQGESGQNQGRIDAPGVVTGPATPAR